MSDSHNQLSRLLEPLKRGLRLLLARGVVKRVDDSGAFQEHQVARLADELTDGLERFQHGLYTRPKSGAEVIVASVAGARSHGVIIAVADRRYRLMDMAEGDVAIADELGQVVHLMRTGIRIESSLKVEISAPEVKVMATTATVDADETTVTGNATVEGNATVNGDVLAKGNVKLGGVGAVQFVKLADGSNSTKVKAL